MKKIDNNLYIFSNRMFEEIKISYNDEFLQTDFQLDYFWGQANKNSMHMKVFSKYFKQCYELHLFSVQSGPKMMVE